VALPCKFLNRPSLTGSTTVPASATASFGASSSSFCSSMSSAGALLAVAAAVASRERGAPERTGVLGTFWFTCIC
jgi:hypothetical protein